MNFTTDQFKNLHDQNEVGNKKTHLLEQKLVELSKFTREMTIAKLETNEQTMGMGASKIEKRVGSRNSRSIGKSEVGNPTTNIVAIPGRYKDF